MNYLRNRELKQDDKIIAYIFSPVFFIESMLIADPA